MVCVASATSALGVASCYFSSTFSRPKESPPSAPFYPDDDEPPKAAPQSPIIRGLSTSSSKSFEVGINRVNEGPKGLNAKNGNGRVITSRIWVQFNDEVVVVLPLPYSWATVSFIGVEAFIVAASF